MNRGNMEKEIEKVVSSLIALNGLTIMFEQYVQENVFDLKEVGLNEIDAVHGFATVLRQQMRDVTDQTQEVIERLVSERNETGEK
jgi:hypothetical protein